MAVTQNLGCWLETQVLGSSLFAWLYVVPTGSDKVGRKSYPKLGYWQTTVSLLKLRLDLPVSLYDIDVFDWLLM